MPVYSFSGVIPVIHPDTFVHPLASIIGDVWIGPNCYIGPFASIRGDFNRIIIERGANVQDNCVIHGYPEQDCIIEEYSHIGHGAIIHTATLRKNSLVGMQALIMDFAEVGENAIVGAQALVPSNFIVPSDTLAIGSPCKIVKKLKQDMKNNKMQGTQLYVSLAEKSLNMFTETQPLKQDNPERSRIDWGEVNPLIKKK